MNNNAFLHLPSPYLLAPTSRSQLQPTWRSNFQLLIQVLERLSDPALNPLLLGTDTEKSLLTYQQFVVGQYCRRKINAKFPFFEVPPKTFEAEIQLEVNLWENLLPMLEELCRRKNFHSEAPALTFYKLIKERLLLLFIAPRGYEEGIAVKVFFAQLQSQNAQLRSCENPFDREVVPTTWEVINQAVKIADLDDAFRKEIYMPYVQARQSFVAKLIEERARIYVGDKLQRQGRRKKKKDKPTSETTSP